MPPPPEGSTPEEKKAWRKKQRNAVSKKKDQTEWARVNYDPNYLDQDTGGYGPRFIAGLKNVSPERRRRY